jgi:PAS domain S-box-containing protein
MKERQTKGTDPREEMKKADRRVAELERENARLRQEATQHRNLLMTASESLIVAQDGRIVFFTPPFADMVSYSPTEFTAADFAEFVHPEDRAGLMKRYAEALANDAVSEDYEFRTVTQSEAVRWYRIRYRASDWNGKPALLCSLREISSEKSAEAKYRDLLEMVPAGVFETDLKTGRFLRVNDLMCAALGYTRGEIMAMDPIAILAPEGRALGKERRELKRQGQPFSPAAEYRVSGKDGREAWVLLTSKVIHHDDGQVTSLLVAQDITERKRAEEERLHMEAHMLETQKLESLGVLAGGIAHDFNNLLAVILGNDLLAQSELPPGSGLARQLDRIRSAAKHAKALTRQMLMYSGKASVSVKPLDLSALVEEMDELLEASVSKKCQLEAVLEHGRTMVEGDPTQLRQVIMNLVTNASEALCDRPGRVVVRTGLMSADAAYLTGTLGRRDLDEGDYVCLEVSDTGEGMDQEIRKRIFEPYFSTKFAGRGLGLASVLGIVRGHGGAIKLVTEPGGGATFRVLLPPATRTDRSAPSEARPRDTAIQGGTILVVDDEEWVLEVAREFLERSEFDVVTAEGGRKALEILRGDAGKTIDAVVLDLSMPDLGGQETFLEIRALFPDLPVIVVSGFGEETSAGCFPVDEIAAFLCKPYEPEDLIDAIRASLAD